MILDATETDLGFFGFDRTAYNGLKKNTRRKMVWRIKGTETKISKPRCSNHKRKYFVYYSKLLSYIS